MKKAKPKLKGILTPDDLQAIGDVVYGLVDKQIATLAAKNDLEGFVTKDDLKELENKMATKDDLKELETDLKVYMNEGFEAVMGGIDAIADKMVEKEKFDHLVVWAEKVGDKVGIRPKI